MGLGIPEVVIIIVAVAVLLFGGKKVVELARGMGRASGEFKKAKMDVERELKQEEGMSDTVHSSSNEPTPTALENNTDETNKNI